jgi:glucosylceramidase
MQKASATVKAWLTTPDRKNLLASQPDKAFASGKTTASDPVLIVDEANAAQSMVGFGAALTDSSAFLLAKAMPEAAREQLLRDLFDPKTGLGFSAVRIPMGASDFSSRGNYTYHDIAPDEPADPELRRFSITPDKAYILPMLRRIRQINPAVTLFATPWSAPAWMKTGRKLNGGWLDWPAYPSFARYFVRFLEEYKREGVPVQYIAPQNEPRNENKDYPTMRMEPRDQARFVRENLGPALEKAGLLNETKILVWDHNWDVPDYPLEILADAGARRYIAGVAWHAYAGQVTAQEKVRTAYPDKEVHFTESSGGDWAKDFGGNLRWDVTNLIVGSVRYGSRSVMKWNLLLDENHGPTNGGCTDCRGIVTLNRKSGAITRNEEFYAFGHASRFVRPGAKRIDATQLPDLPAVAFRNPDGGIALIVCNNSKTDARFTLRHANQSLSVVQPAGSVATYTWPTTG